MSPEQILAKMAKQREFTVDLDGGKRITLRRPTELQIQTQIVRLVPGEGGEAKASIGLDTDSLRTYAVGWAGVVESDLLGSAGGSDEVPLHPDLLQAWLEDNPAHAATLVNALLEHIVAHINAKDESAKN